MGATAFVSVEEYLTTSYRPDCDYVNGEVLERNFGRKDHSRLQGQALFWFMMREQSLGLAAFPEQRLRVGPRRFRVPDICVYQRPEPDEQIFTRPPYICIEILSPEDRLARVQERLDDYLAMGVVNVWLLDPETKGGWWITAEGHFEALDRILRTRDGKVEMPIQDLFD